MSRETKVKTKPVTFENILQLKGSTNSSKIFEFTDFNRGCYKCGSRNIKFICGAVSLGNECMHIRIRLYCGLCK